MGYTTNFEGEVKIEPAPSLELIGKYTGYYQSDSWPEPCPKSYCQWYLKIKNDGSVCLCWNGGEKFYDYVSWLVYAIERIFKPAGHVLNGVFEYSGEDTDDNGRIIVKDNRVAVVKNRQAQEILSSLIAELRSIQAKDLPNDLSMNKVYDFLDEYEAVKG